MTDAVWTTREGNKIPVTEMTDDHLVNALDFLWRNAADESENFERIDTFEWIDILEAERRRRWTAQAPS